MRGCSLALESRIAWVGSVASANGRYLSVGGSEIAPHGCIFRVRAFAVRPRATCACDVRLHRVRVRRVRTFPSRARAPPSHARMRSPSTFRSLGPLGTAQTPKSGGRAGQVGGWPGERVGRLVTWRARWPGGERQAAWLAGSRVACGQGGSGLVESGCRPRCKKARRPDDRLARSCLMAPMLARMPSAAQLLRYASCSATAFMASAPM